jgi:glycosyltransferase involved in cell wall biosynthesis
MTVPISVVIPVGPLPHHRAHLDECLASVAAQTAPTDDLVMVDDVMYPGLGLPGAFNKGVELARNELVFLLGSDDLIMPNCLLRCWQAWQVNPHPLGWFFVGVRNSTGYEQNTASLAAMVTKTLWDKAGGLRSDFNPPYPSCEIEFISRMLIAGGKLGATYRVSDEILYFWRNRDVVPA